MMMSSLLSHKVYMKIGYMSVFFPTTFLPITLDPVFIRHSDIFKEMHASLTSLSYELSQYIELKSNQRGCILLILVILRTSTVLGTW